MSLSGDALKSLAFQASLSPKEEMLEIGQKKQSLYIGIPKETELQEQRVALVPESVGLLVANGHRVVVESGAGEKANFSDSDYSESGAEIIIAINASPFTISKYDERNDIALSRVKETKLPIVYLNRTGGQDELIFDGSSFSLNYDGKKFSSLEEFKEDISTIKFNKRIHLTFADLPHSITLQEMVI